MTMPRYNSLTGASPDDWTDKEADGKEGYNPLKKIAIIGPGAMGCLFGTYLEKAGLEVTLLDHNPQRAARLNRTGIVVEGVYGRHKAHVNVETDAKKVGPVDLVLVSVKAFCTQTAMQSHQALVDNATAVWSLQNGLGNIDALAEIVPCAQMLGGTTTLGANMLETGRIHHAGDGEIFVGELDGSDSERLSSLVETFRAAGLPVQISGNIKRVMWSKLLINVGINALTAILKVRNGFLVRSEPARQIMRAAVDEALEVAHTQGLVFDRKEIHGRVEQVALCTADNRSSMLVDSLAGRATEIEFINGAIARLGHAPINQTLTHLVLAQQVTQK
jgi:2-dehydropantoate 2-reductase